MDKCAGNHKTRNRKRITFQKKLVLITFCMFVVSSVCLLTCVHIDGGTISPPMIYKKMVSFNNYECENDIDTVKEYPPEYIHVTIVMCTQPGSQGEVRQQRQSAVMLKSILLQQTSPFVLHVFYNNDEVLQFFNKVRRSFSEEYSRNLILVGHKVCVQEDSIVNVFRPCAMLRLIIPHYLRHVDSVIYLDTDIILLRPLEGLFKQFSMMHHQSLAMARVVDYGEICIHPANGLAFNSGVLLMNLTRIREMPENWETSVLEIVNRYMANLTLADQCVLNLLSIQYPHHFWELPCEWNYKREHYWGKIPCPTAAVNGSSLVHGVSSTFMEDSPIRPFHILFSLMEKFQFGFDVNKSLVDPLVREVVVNHTCIDSFITVTALTKALTLL